MEVNSVVLLLSCLSMIFFFTFDKIETNFRDSPPFSLGNGDGGRKGKKIRREGI